jgi:putative phosphoribosyl transferase
LLAEIRRLELGPELVLALPRGGVPVAAEIASGLSVPLDMILVRKVSLPGNPELALGAVSDGSEMRFVMNETVAAAYGISHRQGEELARAQLPELERRRSLYCGDRVPLPVTGRHVIVVDDGMATGATARAALRLLREDAPASITLAVPVSSPEALELAARLADRVVCLEAPRNFMAVGAFYRDFAQTTDSEVIALVEKFGPQTDLA